MKDTKTQLSPKQVRKMLYGLNQECSDSTIYRHSKKFVWELTNDQSYDEWADDYFTIIVLKNGKFFDAITPKYAKEILNDTNI